MHRMLGCLLLCAPLAVAADPLGPPNRATLARGTALPLIGAGVEPGVRITLDVANEFVAETAERESLVVDAETLELALEGRVALGAGVIGLRVPVVRRGGGALDGFIEDWHSTFGLPNGGRERAPEGRARVRYVRDGAVLIDAADGGAALGDIEVSAGWTPSPGLSLHAMLEAPTADADVVGGGALGGALWAELAGAAAKSPWTGFVGGGVSLGGRGAVLDGLRRPLVPVGAAGVRYRLGPALEFGAQLHAHGALYDDSALPALERPGVSLALGGTWRCAPRLALDLAIQEDLVTRSSPDFGVHLALRLLPAAP